MRTLFALTLVISAAFLIWLSYVDHDARQTSRESAQLHQQLVEQVEAHDQSQSDADNARRLREVQAAVDQYEADVEAAQTQFRESL